VATIDVVLAGLDAGISLEDLDRLPPAKLRKFAALCGHWQALADARVRKLPPNPDPAPPSSSKRASAGVLSDLSDGRGRQ
jgi:hypothetical protein